jgi:hypothetical protein
MSASQSDAQVFFGATGDLAYKEISVGIPLGYTPRTRIPFLRKGSLSL